MYLIMKSINTFFHRPCKSEKLWREERREKWEAKEFTWGGVRKILARTEKSIPGILKSSAHPCIYTGVA